jgi:urea transport system substrate-binding protein
MRKTYWTQLLLISAMAMWVAPPTQSQEKKPVVIAIPVGLSGVNSVVAPAVVQSAELAADELNPKGAFSDGR